MQKNMSFLMFRESDRKNCNYKWEVWRRGKLSVEFTRRSEGHVRQVLYGRTTKRQFLKTMQIPAKKKLTIIKNTKKYQRHCK